MNVNHIYFKFLLTLNQCINFDILLLEFDLQNEKLITKFAL